MVYFSGEPKEFLTHKCFLQAQVAFLPHTPSRKKANLKPPFWYFGTSSSIFKIVKFLTSMSPKPAPREPHSRSVSHSIQGGWFLLCKCISLKPAFSISDIQKNHIILDSHFRGGSFRKFQEYGCYGFMGFFLTDRNRNDQ